MELVGGFAILDQTKTGDRPRAFAHAAAEIVARGMRICGVAQENMRVEVIADSYDKTKKHLVILMAEDRRTLEAFFDGETDKYVCFKKALAEVQKRAAADGMIAPIEVSALRGRERAFAVVAVVASK